MKLILTQEEVLEVLHDCLCNALSVAESYGLELATQQENNSIRQYGAAKSRWLKANPGKTACYEDVLTEILRNGESLVFVDVESEEEYDDCQRHKLTLADAKVQFEKP